MVFFELSLTFKKILSQSINPTDRLTDIQVEEQAEVISLRVIVPSNQAEGHS